MGERPKKKESKPSGDGTVMVLALAGAAFLASKYGGVLPDSDQLPFPTLSVDRAVSAERAEERFDCNLQDGESLSAEQVACAQRVAHAIGKTSFKWDRGDNRCLDELWHNESNWNSRADNPTSSAYGIPQALTQLHTDLPRDYENNPVSQIRWGVDYIAGRYGDPCDALDAWEARSPHWY